MDGGFVKRNIRVTIPSFGFRRGDYINWGKVCTVAWMSLLFIVVAGFTIAGSYWVIRRITAAPPRVVIVHDNGLTSAQNAFIKQCDAAYIIPPASQEHSNGIPNVEVTPWTCQFSTNGQNNSSYSNK